MPRLENLLATDPGNPAKNGTWWTAKTLQPDEPYDPYVWISLPPKTSASVDLVPEFGEMFGHDRAVLKSIGTHNAFASAIGLGDILDSFDPDLLDPKRDAAGPSWHED